MAALAVGSIRNRTVRFVRPLCRYNGSGLRAGRSRCVFGLAEDGPTRRSQPSLSGLSLIDSDGQALYQSDPTYVKQTQKCLETGDAWTADTWEALAEKMKVDPKALRASIEEWNALVDSTQKDALGRKRKTMRKLLNHS